ncbi:MAG TPA: family 43 glycosylhydrolase, partial [Povalibacter sp.]|nr:family 43 glycosylhydrolase [Povalibacter sp.]
MTVLPRAFDDISAVAPRLSRRDVLRGSLALGAAVLIADSGAAHADAINESMSGNFFPVHDPCIVRAGDTYHVFSTGQQADSTGLLPWRTSQDLVHWELQGHVFDAIPDWAQQAIPGTRGLWAPDVAWFNDAFHLYYSCSTFGSNRSVIGLVTN